MDLPATRCAKPVTGKRHVLTVALSNEWRFD